MPVTQPVLPGSSPDSRLASALLLKLVATGVVPTDTWDELSPSDQTQIAAAVDLASLVEALAVRRLLTPYQALRIRAGAVNGLVLGNYRVLDKIGAGGMGVVFRGEHLTFRTPVAIKALYVDGQKHRRSVDRFFLEVRAVATLKHPNIVAAVDAGEEPAAGPDGQAVPYLVMEYVPGSTLEDLIDRDGPMPVARAAAYAHQIADALTESHRCGLVHRDIKPSNIMIGPNGLAKLLDFGVARLPATTDRMTLDGAHLGTVGYMAPEQARNPRDVDGRADVFGLAATVFFALTGHMPFLPPGGSSTAKSLPSIREFRPELPAVFDSVLSRMMALDPITRTPTAAAAMRELAQFLGWSGQNPTPVTIAFPTARPTGPAPEHRGARVLIVDDEEPIRRVCRIALQHEPVHCDEAGTGPDAVASAMSHAYDLILLDVDLPGLNGELVLRKIRQQPPSAHLKVIMLSGRTPGDDLSRLLAAGADDFLTKPFSVVQLRSRVKAALRLKDAQDRSDLLTNRLAASNGEMERAISARDGELIHARGAMVLALAKLVERRSSETGAHLLRLQRYCRVLAEFAARTPAFADRLDPAFVMAIEAAAPLHDIGKVAIPDYVLNKPGRLTSDERAIMETHTTAGADTLAEVSARYPFATGFFHTAVEIARYHHEKWDGTGYPDRLSGEAIPLSARLVAIADVYDALRGRRVYKPGFTHEAAVAEMLDRSPGHFDPALLEVFRQIPGQFDRVFRDAVD